MLCAGNAEASDSQSLKAAAALARLQQKLLTLAQSEGSMSMQSLTAHMKAYLQTTGMACRHHWSGHLQATAYCPIWYHSRLNIHVTSTLDGFHSLSNFGKRKQPHALDMSCSACTSGLSQIAVCDIWLCCRCSCTAPRVTFNDGGQAT